MNYPFYSRLICLIFCSSLLIRCNLPVGDTNTRKVLVFTKTLEYRHQSIDDGIKMLEKLGKENRFRIEVSEDASLFNDDSLKQFNAIVFLNTTGEVLNFAQQNGLRRYMEAGGGFVAIHGSSATLNHSAWFRGLIGTRFKNHSRIQQGKLLVHQDDKFPTTKSLTPGWTYEDEWYNWDTIPRDVHVLVSIDEQSYQGGEHPEFHPLAWYHEYEKGKSFYTALGHSGETYQDPKFAGLILDGLNYVMQGQNLDYRLAVTPSAPDPKDLIKESLVSYGFVQEPMAMDISPDGKIFYAERRGNIRVHNIQEKKTSIIGTIPVYSEHEDGLLGIALDPDFRQNHWLYVFYSAPVNQFNYHLSRFTYDPKTNHLLDTTEMILLKIPQEHPYSNHTGGRICFDRDKNLYLTTGDNTIPFGSKGFAPIDQRKDRTEYDASRSSGNTNDLRGKILRIHPEPNGTYTIPAGNLFPPGMPKTRPEIYIMGCRNPFSVLVDSATNILYWGEVGPDAHKDSLEGPRGYDEINHARKAGNYGWPFFIGDSKPYAEVDFVHDKIGEFFNPERPMNNGPRNTGLKILPPVHEAFIWYPYADSQEFPEVGAGGRSAMAGPVYHFTKSSQLSDSRLPEYFDKGFIIYEWIRNWIKVVRMDDEHNYIGMEPFAPEAHFSSITDMKFGPDGLLYVLEYGKTWYQHNEDAGISRIIYSPKK